MSKFQYGSSWEKFPIETGETWGLPDGSRFAVHDIFFPLPRWMKADLLFVDPPYNGGMLRGYYTKADLEPGEDADFEYFTEALFDQIHNIGAPTVYVEIGNQALRMFEDKMAARFPHVQHWKVTYYRRNQTNLLRGSHITPINYDYSGIDEAECIQILTRIEQYQTIADPCMGRGLVGLAAYSAGKPFVGTELNKRRLAVLLDKLDRAGAQVSRIE